MISQPTSIRDMLGELMDACGGDRADCLILADPGREDQEQDASGRL